uniref:Uncharacterized protein n=1 Tax=Zea mays TaxID=4577 RepID=C0HHT6_MAIZE|nr:unknown [Zea mays]
MGTRVSYKQKDSIIFWLFHRSINEINQSSQLTVYPISQQWLLLAHRKHIPIAIPLSTLDTSKPEQATNQSTSMRR